VDLSWQADLAYLEQKFLSPDYSRSEGLTHDEIVGGLERLYAETRHLSHTLAKAQAFRYVLANTRIEASPHDWFIGIEEYGKKSVEQSFCRSWIRELFAGKLADADRKMRLNNEIGRLRTYIDYCHSVPDYDAILTLGFPGLLERAEAYRQMHEESGTMTPAVRDYFDAIRLEYTAILAFLDRLIGMAAARDDARSRMTCDCLSALRAGPPGNIYEALQLIWIYFLLSEYVDVLQVRSFGNLDRILYPFYKQDLALGTFNQDQIRAFFRYFMMQASAMHYTVGHPFYFGGTDALGRSEINELSFLILEEYDQMGIYDPKLQIKLAPNTPSAFINKCLDMIRRGHNSIVFVCEPAIRSALIRRGIRDLDDIRTCNVHGCYEVSPSGKSVATAGGAINMAKLLELTFNNGVDPVSGRQAGPETGDCVTFQSYADFYQAYLRQAVSALDDQLEITRSYDDYYLDMNPAPMFSATIKSSLIKGFDAYAGGAEHYSAGIMIMYVGTVADSLMAVKKYVYDRKVVSLAELKQALGSNWVGYESLRDMIRRDKDKYGNNRTEVDQIARDLAETMAGLINGQSLGKIRRATSWATLHCTQFFQTHSPITGATPDGRRKGDELSKNISPSSGMNDTGATGLILSATKMDVSLFPADFPVDITLHPSATQGEAGLAAMRGLLMTYMNRGGNAIHFNVFDGQTLRDAQQRPEAYADLQIRVCGWNVLWNNLSRWEQDNYILQAEAHS
jgi:formate C-acetyltransferase